MYGLLVVLVGFQSGVFSQTLPVGFSTQSLATGISAPTCMAFAPDGRLFIGEQNGAIKVYKNGALLGTPFTQLTVNSTGERGLLGLEFDPNYATNGFVYVYYTRPGSPLRNRVSRLTSNPANRDVMLAGSETLVVQFDPLSATNHNGGSLKFGPDGKLYVAIGENAVTANAQNYDNYLGKLLRINADGSAPSDNPFYASTPDGTPPTDASQRLWALGLRNPYSFAIAPSTGTIFVNDVGGNQYEEINDATQGGQNFGWPTQEGPPIAGFSGPAYYYANNSQVVDSDSSGCSVLGGTFLSSLSSNYPVQYQGKYFFMDYCNGWIRYIDPAHIPANGSTLFGEGFGTGLVSMTVGPDGTLYYLHRGTGSLNRFVYSPPTIESIASGNWNDPSAWSCACVPASTDEVIVRTGHSIVVDGIMAQAKNVALDGGQVQVENNGTLQLNH